MPRKKSKREPTPMEEGEQIIESAEKAGADYAQEQVGSPHFSDWVYDQMVEAERMRKADPSSVVPLETPADAKKVARNMLQQLEWDTKRQMDLREVLDLIDGATGVFSVGSADWVRDTYGITEREVTGAFFTAFVDELREPSVVTWLTDLVLEAGEEVRGSEVSESRRRGGLEAARTGMTPEQRDTIVAALRHYGGDLSDDGFIAHGKKVLGVRPEISKGRLRMVSKTGELLASYTVANIGTGVADFVEKFWFWKPQGASVHEQRAVRDYIAVDYRGRAFAGPFTDYGRAKREASKASGFVKFVPGQKVRAPRRSTHRRPGRAR